MCEHSLMGWSFWSTAIRYCAPLTSHPSVGYVTLWGWMLRLRSWLTRLSTSGHADTRPAGSAGVRLSTSLNSSGHSNGDSNAPVVTLRSKPLTIRVIPSSSLPARARRATWRTRWHRRMAQVRWTAQVAKYLYQHDPVVLVHRADSLGSAQRRRRVSQVRPDAAPDTDRGATP